MDSSKTVLVAGEVIVDYVLPHPGRESKLRLGGIVHAARGLWASGIDYAVAAICPKYLKDRAEDYLYKHGCNNFIWLGEVIGSPNVIAIGDVAELSHQGYDDILRDDKKVLIRNATEELDNYREILIFPGNFDLQSILRQSNRLAKFSLDIAYGIKSFSELEGFKGRIRSLSISTSSELFLQNDKNFEEKAKNLAPEAFLLKENRGGSRLFNFKENRVENIPAELGTTQNSVGVGDVYSAVMVGLRENGWIDAAWRGSRAATYYSRTTYPDDLKRDIQRDNKTSLKDIKSLHGTLLPWHERQNYKIYLAAPDFSYINKPEIDNIVSSLEYHNFKLHRPILENGELPKQSGHAELEKTYHQDCDLLAACDMIVAVPLERDPGTLVEIGLAIALGKPVITFDPRGENNNTMVIIGSHVYSQSLDECLNGVFNTLSSLRTSRT